MSARPGRARSIVHPWKLFPITANGGTGRKPFAQLARSEPRRIFAVTSGHDRAELLRPIADGTKTSSVRSIAARSDGAIEAAWAAGASETASAAPRIATVRRTVLRH